MKSSSRQFGKSRLCRHPRHRNTSRRDHSQRRDQGRRRSCEPGNHESDSRTPRSFRRGGASRFPLCAATHCPSYGQIPVQDSARVPREDFWTVCSGGYIGYANERWFRSRPQHSAKDHGSSWWDGVLRQRAGRKHQLPSRLSSAPGNGYGVRRSWVRIQAEPRYPLS